MGNNNGSNNDAKAVEPNRFAAELAPLMIEKIGPAATSWKDREFQIAEMVRLLKKLSVEYPWFGEAIEEGNNDHGWIYVGRYSDSGC